MARARRPLGILAAAFTLLVALVAWQLSRGDALNLFFMRFFRNLGRAKARARRMGGATSLTIATSSLEVMMGLDDPATAVDYDAEQTDGPESYSFSAEELRDFGNGEAGKPLLLSLFGRIYDVSAGQAFYGPEAKYHGFVAKDATRSFCTGCLKPECLIASTHGLSPAQLKEGHRWLEFFQLHDQYAFAGRLEAEPPVDLEALVADAINAEKDVVETTAPGDADGDRAAQR